MKIRIANDSDKPELKRIRRDICSIGLEDDHIVYRLDTQSRGAAEYLVAEDNGVEDWVIDMEKNLPDD